MRHALLAFSLIALLSPLAAPAETRLPESAAEISLSFAPVVRSAAPAVVNIYATRVVEQRVSPLPPIRSSTSSSGISVAASRGCRTRWAPA